MSYVNLDWIQAINMLPSSIVDLRLSGCSLSSPAVPPHHLSLLNSSSSFLSLLDLSSNSLTSEIYPWLFNFVGHSLVHLDLSGNHLEGPIPDAFENLTSLAHLDLSANQIQGGIPKSLGNLLHLQTLDISDNDLSGNLPEIVRNLYGHDMNTLEILDLGRNKISGNVPDITIFSSLKKLDLSYNNLNGSLPNRFEHLSKLKVLDMSDNHITGSLPDLSVFSSLQKFSLYSNQINGNLPESICQLSKLEYLDVSSNKLQGTISKAHFSNLTQLTFLDLSNNHLILDLSSEWQPPFQLETIRLRSCKLGSYFPIWLQTQKNVTYLDISNSSISDVIPSWFWDSCYNTWHLNLSYNHINGILPDLSSKSFNFQIIDFSSNHLEGPIPTFVSSIISLDLSINKFKGSISVLCAMIGGPLVFLDLSYNKLFGELPDCWWQKENDPMNFQIRRLNLANNNFSGKIPSSMGSLQDIESLHLNNNSLNGELPSSLQNCTNLEVIDIGENRLSGNVPAWIGEKLSSLIILRLHSNEFYGSIPVQLCYLTQLQVLDISLNNITGTIPGCINNFTAMAQKVYLYQTAIKYPQYLYSGHTVEDNYTENVMVLWKGTLSKYRNTLRLLRSIDLSCNNLTGEIPSEITHLSELVLLNLSRNSLTGLIPYNIGRLASLDSLDLSRNQLFGEIPVSMSDLSSLGELDMSNNNLSGKIPSGTPLQRREASAFSGNPALCGSPLTQMCPGDDIFPIPPTASGEDADIQEEDEFVFDRWFYASIALGFIVGFWGVCGTLVLHRSWRRAYFQCFYNSKDWLYVRIAVHKARMMRKFQS